MPRGEPPRERREKTEKFQTFSRPKIKVARTSAEVRSVKTMFVYRDPPRTAQAP